jgi:hypothetical protein
MDIYLPADFHELHDAAPDDWRDISTSSATHERPPSSNTQSTSHRTDSPDACVDPSWRVI